MATPLPPTTADELLEWRRNTAHITQRDTAALLGIGHRTWWAFEKGERPVPLWLGWALVGIQKTAQSEIRHRKRRNRFNAKRRITRRRVGRVPRLMRQRLRLSHARMDILEKAMNRGQVKPGEWAVIDGLSDEIHSLTERLPRGMRG